MQSQLVRLPGLAGHVSPRVPAAAYSGPERNCDLSYTDIGPHQLNLLKNRFARDPPAPPEEWPSDEQRENRVLKNHRVRASAVAVDPKKERLTRARIEWTGRDMETSN